MGSWGTKPLNPDPTAAEGHPDLYHLNLELRHSDPTDPASNYPHGGGIRQLEGRRFIDMAVAAEVDRDISPRVGA